MIIKSGATRTVILTKKYAIKIPGNYNYKRKWRSLLNGLLANIQEHDFCNMSKKLCPVVFYIRGGFLVVMPRGKDLSNKEWSDFDYVGFVEESDYSLSFIEDKPCSFKKFGKEIKAVDYGN